MLKNSIFDDMIGRNEKVLWKGKPDFKCFILESIFNPMLPFAIVWALFDSMFIVAFFAGFHHGQGMPKELVNYSVVPLIGFFALHLMPVWIYLGGVIFSFLRYQHTEFAITDRGVYCSGGIFAQTFENKPFAELSHVNIHRGIIDQMLGVGDVVLTSQHDGYNTRQINSLYRGITICDIPDFQQVYKIVKQLQTDVYSDTMYPNDLRPKENHGYNTEYKGFREL